MIAIIIVISMHAIAVLVRMPAVPPLQLPHAY